MTRRLAVCLLLFAVVSGFALWTTHPVTAQDSEYRGRTWEYRVFRMDPGDYTTKSDYKALLQRDGMRKVDASFREYVLNFLGNDGWELISVEQRSKSLVYFYMKRPKR
jgi:hypothetical protein